VSVTQQNSPKKRSLLPLWILVVLFALPSLAAWFFYLNPEYLPASRSNRGELIHPVRPVDDLTLTTPDGQAFALRDLEGNWTMVATTEGPCGETCRQHLFAFNQIRLALADNRYRAERVLLYATPAQAADAEAVAEQFPGTRVLIAEADTSIELQSRFESLDGGRFLIDPMGNLMMRYALGAPPQDMLKDLEKLFKASKNWIKGAQYGHR
jgi:hypothetical protein